MSKNTFKMSDAVRDQLAAGLDGLAQTQKTQILGAIATLAAEIEVYCRVKAMDDMRKQWSESLATMFLIEPKTKKAE